MGDGIHYGDGMQAIHLPHPHRERITIFPAINYQMHHPFINSFSGGGKDPVKSNHQLRAVLGFQKHSQVKNMHLGIKKYGILIQRSSSINHVEGLKRNVLTGTEVARQEQGQGHAGKPDGCQVAKERRGEAPSAGSIS